MGRALKHCWQLHPGATAVIRSTIYLPLITSTMNLPFFYYDHCYDDPVGYMVSSADSVASLITASIKVPLTLPTLPYLLFLIPAHRSSTHLGI